MIEVWYNEETDILALIKRPLESCHHPNHGTWVFIGEL